MTADQLLDKLSDDYEAALKALADAILAESLARGIDPKDLLDHFNIEDEVRDRLPTDQE